MAQSRQHRYSDIRLLGSRRAQRSGKAPGLGSRYADSGVEGERAWMTCSCGAVLSQPEVSARPLPPSTDALEGGQTATIPSGLKGPSTPTGKVAPR